MAVANLLDKALHVNPVRFHVLHANTWWLFCYPTQPFFGVLFIFVNKLIDCDHHVYKIHVIAHHRLRIVYIVKNHKDGKPSGS
jgi:hypothetical protein